MERKYLSHLNGHKTHVFHIRLLYKFAVFINANHIDALMQVTYHCSIIKMIQLSFTIKPLPPSHYFQIVESIKIEYNKWLMIFKYDEFQSNCVRLEALRITNPSIFKSNILQEMVISFHKYRKQTVIIFLC